MFTAKVGCCLVHNDSAGNTGRNDSFRQAVHEGKVRLVECECGGGPYHYRLEVQELFAG